MYADPSGHDLTSVLVTVGLGAVIASLLFPNTANAPTSARSAIYGDTSGDILFGLAFEIASPLAATYALAPALKAVAPVATRLIGFAKGNVVVALLARQEGVKLLEAADLNSEWLSQGGYAAWSEGSSVVQYETATAGQYVRVYGEGGSSVGGWVARAQDIKGLDAAQIQDALGLSFRPAYIQPVTVPVGTTVRAGITGANQFGEGGLFQLQLVSRIPTSNFGVGVPIK
jgi:hypothetical protein